MSNALPVPDPSMDEILASIKRIIESGDEKVVKRAPVAVASGAVAPGSAAARSIPAGYAEALRPEEDAGDDLAASEEAPEPHWDLPVPPAPDASGDEPMSPSADMADALPAPLDDEPEDDHAAAGSRFDEQAFESELLGRVGLIEPHDERAGKGSPAVEADNPDGPARFSAANSDDAGLRHGAQPTLDEPPIVAARALADPAAAQRLLSEEAGARVAASFEDLTRAIREDQMRSVEDAVQEMLRPMLQEWLDDNLPRLVERLVREEIERVATGGRR